jgi:hypothetical protein
MTAGEDVGGRLLFVSAHTAVCGARWMLERQSPQVKQVQHDGVKRNYANRINSASVNS